MVSSLQRALKTSNALGRTNNSVSNNSLIHTNDQSDSVHNLNEIHDIDSFHLKNITLPLLIEIIIQFFEHFFLSNERCRFFLFLRGVEV